MNHTLLLILYISATAGIITAEHLTVGRWWRGNELARRTLGHATILGVALIFVPTGLIEWESWLAITAATAVSGAIIAASHVHRHETKRHQQSDQLVRKIEEITDGAA